MNYNEEYINRLLEKCSHYLQEHNEQIYFLSDAIYFYYDAKEKVIEDFIDFIHKYERDINDGYSTVKYYKKYSDISCAIIWYIVQTKIFSVRLQSEEDIKNRIQESFDNGYDKKLLDYLESKGLNWKSEIL